ncbi:ATP-dependent protease [Shewanella mesophila]|uniref:LON peptidase substrate-binding domain-containing protein n=1 Tax=Shewanella mesophila TaxID=2864208 RepID=UPI001C657E60|nr:ATP-dependent protease [Shewanella mesophila]QYJ84937.1 ATP-dependent protease [Shewanella mesophila]
MIEQDIDKPTHEIQAHEAAREMAVFPLPLFILPDGIQRLRIFEARYLSMVVEAGERGGFVIARYDSNLAFNVPKWGTRVEIIDFHSDEGGILVVDVKGLNLVDLQTMRYRDDRLLLADSHYRPFWSVATVEPGLSDMGRLLEKLFEKNAALANLYPNPKFENLDWVCARLLEILPLSLNEKEKFIEPSMFDSLKVFLHTFIFGNENIN